jgi:hypothetical protein
VTLGEGSRPGFSGSGEGAYCTVSVERWTRLSVELNFMPSIFNDMSMSKGKEASNLKNVSKRNATDATRQKCICTTTRETFGGEEL